MQHWLCIAIYRLMHEQHFRPALSSPSEVITMLNRNNMTEKMKWATTWQNQQSECAPSEDSDQPGYPPNLFSIFAVQLVAKGPSFLHADSEESDQTVRMPRLIWVFAGRTATLLVLSCRGSNSTRSKVRLNMKRLVAKKNTKPHKIWIRKNTVLILWR